MSAAERWDRGVAGWRPPEWILRQAPANPVAYPPALFQSSSERVAAVATERFARAALRGGGTVLDVGAGGGIASMRLADDASLMVGVDLSTAMLANFAEAAEAAGVAHEEIVGRWPEVAERTPRCDVVVCRNVVFMNDNVARFVSALDEWATRRVVVELPDRHPGQKIAPLWKHFWGHECPEGPVADDFVEVVRELGFDPVVRREARPPGAPGVSRAQFVTYSRLRLCLPAEREPEIDAVLGPELPATTAVTLAWEHEL